MNSTWNGITLNVDHGLSNTYRKIASALDDVPALHFKQEWDVRVIPPFGGAMMRFTVSQNDVKLSVYCDFFDELGYVGEPYWELYPRTYKDSTNGDYIDVQRFKLNETSELIKAIDDELNGVPV